MVTEELQDFFIHQAYIATNDAYVISNQVVILIDEVEKTTCLPGRMVQPKE